MISRQTITHPFNRGDYTVGAPSQAKWARHTPVGDGPAALQGETVTVPDGVLAELREVAAAVHVERAEVVARTRDWWAGSMIGETEGRPATPDAVVVEAADADQVAAVLRICHAAGVPVTPSAGRSNVTGAALPVFGGVVLDVCRLDRITGFDAESNVVDVEAGMFGDLFEKQLQEEYGVTTGHWPSAFAVSTVGGWIACRGAGQLSTRYGKIEDMVVGVDVVHADGTRATYGDYARAAVGPDLRQLFVGSEGTLGVIVSARLRVHPLPAYAKAVAYGFGSFAEGLDACRAIMQRGATPAVLRLYDRLESGTHFGHPETNLLLIADEGDPALVDAGLAVASEVCAASGTELDGEAVFARWLDERMLVGKSSDGFTPAPASSPTRWRWRPPGRRCRSSTTRWSRRSSLCRAPWPPPPTSRTPTPTGRASTSRCGATWSRRRAATGTARCGTRPTRSSCGTGRRSATTTAAVCCAAPTWRNLSARASPPSPR